MSKQIKQKIASLRVVNGIASAMKMIAIAKYKKYLKLYHAVNKHNEALLSFPACMQPVLSNILPSHSNLCVVLGSDLGMCGAFNNALWRLFAHLPLNAPQNLIYSNIPISPLIKLSSIAHALVKLDINNYLNLCPPFYAQFINTAAPIITNNLMLKAIDITMYVIKNSILSVRLVYNKMIDSAKFLPVEELIWLEPDKNFFDARFADKDLNAYDPTFNHIIEPKLNQMREIYKKYALVSQIYGALVNNLVAQNFSAMINMDKASNNTKDLIENLNLIFNRSRQSGITQELSEIIGGMEALMDN